MPNERLLLDTTVQLWRIVHGPEETQRFHQEFVDKTAIYTTSFVFREFLNTIIADLEYVHLQTSEVLTPAEDGRVGLDRLARFLATGRGNYSSRSIQRLHLVIGELLESFEHTRVPKSKILVRLERTARRWIRDFFRYQDRNGGEQAVICLTALDDTPDDIRTMRQGGPFPQHPRFPKKAARFLEDRKAQVARIVVEMRKATRSQGRDDKLLKVLGWLEDKDGDFDFSNGLRQHKLWNWALGDLLIVLESPADAAIYSTDRTFAILTRALGTQLYRGYRVPD